MSRGHRRPCLGEPGDALALQLPVFDASCPRVSLSVSTGVSPAVEQAAIWRQNFFFFGKLQSLLLRPSIEGHNTPLIVRPTHILEGNLLDSKSIDLICLAQNLLGPSA